MRTFADFRPTAFDARGLGSDGRGDWLVAPVGQTRDSEALERSNFACGLRLLQAADKGEDVTVERFGHWGPGWFEIIVVRPGSPAAEVAATIEARLEDYPVLDEDHFSAEECEEAAEAWTHTSLRERIELCAEDGISIFAARHGWIPREDSGRIVQALLSH